MWNCAIAGLILFLPFQFATNLFAGADVSLFRLLILGVFFVWLFLSVWEKKLFLPSGQLLWIFLGIGSILCSLWIAGQPEWAMRKGFFLVNFLLWFVMLSSLMVQRKLEKESAIKAIVWSGGMVATLGCLQWLGQFVFGLQPMLLVWREWVAPFFLGNVFSEAVLEYPSWLVSVGGHTIFRAIATFPDPHMFAFFLELCLPFALFSFLKTKKKKYIFLAGIIFFGILLSFSRGAYIGVIAGIVVAVGIVWYHRGFHLREGMVIGTFFFMGLGFLFGTQNFVRDRLEDTFLNVDSSGEERLFLWGHAWGIVMAYPIFGVGLGGYPETVQPSAQYRDPIYAHNLYLDIATEMGLVGLMLWVFGMGWAVKQFFLLGKENVVFFGGAVALIMLSVHGLFDTPIYSVHVLGMLCVVVSLAGGRRKRSCQNS